MPPFKRIRLSDTFGFLSRLRVGRYIVLIGVLGGLFYAGYHLSQSGNTALPTMTTVQHERGEKGTKNERGEKGTKIEENTSLVKSDVEKAFRPSERGLKERKARSKKGERLIASHRNEFTNFKSKLTAHHQKNPKKNTEQVPP